MMRKKIDSLPVGVLSRERSDGLYLILSGDLAYTFRKLSVYQNLTYSAFLLKLISSEAEQFDGSVITFKGV